MNDKQPINLRPGDYVLTSELRDEAHYREVGEAFIRAGAETGEFPNDRWAMNQSILPGFGWSPEGGLYHGQGASNGDEWGYGERRLTPGQVIAAAPGKPADSQIVDTALDRYRTAQRQAEERAAWDGYVAGLSARIPDVMRVASTADALLELRRERFPD